MEAERLAVSDGVKHEETKTWRGNNAEYIRHGIGVTHRLCRTFCTAAQYNRNTEKGRQVVLAALLRILDRGTVQEMSGNDLHLKML